MTKRRGNARWIMRFALLIAGTILATGCHGGTRWSRPVVIANTSMGTMTVAVAPAINLSGSRDFDANRVADFMASELSYAKGVSIIPVSRVLGVLAAQGLDQVKSRSHAMELVGLLGADAILVFSVTEYDPYDPPRMGISAQLFGTRSDGGGGLVKPIALTRQASLRASPTGSTVEGLLSQTQRVFDASHGSVANDIRRFARGRQGDPSPYGWRKYVVSQQHFIRYCCHATIRELLNERTEFSPAEAEAKR